MTIHLLDKTLKIDIFYEDNDQAHEDNICVSIMESCPPAERLFRMGHTNVYLTSEQARQIGEALLAAARHSETDQPEQAP